MLNFSSFCEVSMRYSTQIKPISYVKAHAAELLDRITEEREPIIITQNGEARAVLVDVASYEQTQETLALLQGTGDCRQRRSKPENPFLRRRIMAEYGMKANAGEMTFAVKFTRRCTEGSAKHPRLYCPERFDARRRIT